MHKRQFQIDTYNVPKCLTQTRSPKLSAKPIQPQIIQQITSLIKSSKERFTERHCKQIENTQNIQTSTTARIKDNRAMTITYHKILEEFRNLKKQDNKENSFNKINRPQQKVRQISYPNVLPLNNSNSRSRIKDSVYQNKVITNKKLAKICDKGYAEQQQSNQYLEAFETICRQSQECSNLLYEIKNDLLKPDKHFRKNSQRCVSADIQQIIRSPKKDSRSSSIDRKESRFNGSTQANSHPQDLDLTCDEEITVNQIKIEERIKTEPDPFIQQERYYLTDPYYLNNQETITWWMRAVVIDWMMGLAEAYIMKRQTFHLAIFYLDTYLSKKQVHNRELQLVGMCSLLIATKIDEIMPTSVEKFRAAADNGYNKEEILKMELDILFTLKWHVNPPTYTYWINWFTDQWDIFANTNHIQIYFRKANEESYSLFRRLCYLVDSTLFDISILQYVPRTIVASFMYLILSFELNVFTHNMLEIMQHSSLFLLNRENQFNNIFGNFVQTTFGFALQDILPAIQYAVGFYDLQIDCQTPPGVQQLFGTPFESNYEEFLSFQCYSQKILQYIKEKQRD